MTPLTDLNFLTQTPGFRSFSLRHEKQNWDTKICMAFDHLNPSFYHPLKTLSKLLELNPGEYCSICEKFSVLIFPLQTSRTKMFLLNDSFWTVLSFSMQHNFIHREQNKINNIQYNYYMAGMKKPNDHAEPTRVER